MLRATRRTGQKNIKPNMKSKPHNIKHPRYRFPGICRHANLLGVHRIHLYHVLVGSRISHSLTRRYKDLLRKERAA